jgi:hypothetical protein
VTAADRNCHDASMETLHVDRYGGEEIPRPVAKCSPRLEPPALDATRREEGAGILAADGNGYRRPTEAIHVNGRVAGALCAVAQLAPGVATEALDGAAIGDEA